MRSSRFDVVVSFLTKINVLALLAKTGTGTPVIVSERNNPLQQRSNPLWGLLLRWLYPRAAAIVMLTERSKICLPATQRSRAIVIPNPMLAPPVEARLEGPPALVAVGRLNEQKGFDLLLRAFADIAEEIPDWRLIIWGEGPDRVALEQQVRDLGIDRSSGIARGERHPWRLGRVGIGLCPLLALRRLRQCAGRGDGLRPGRGGVRLRFWPARHDHA